MTTTSPELATATETVGGHSYIDWGAIIAGAIFAAAVSFLFMTFGAAVGLSATSPIRGEGFSTSAVLIATGIWIVWVQVSAFMMGGYLSGRLRARWFDATPHEVEVRDGAHGLMVWALGALLGAYMAASAVTTVANKGVTALATVAGAAVQSTTPENVVNKLDPTGYLVDSMFRAETSRPPADDTEARAEVGRILAASASSGKVKAEDRAYIARVVAARTNLLPEAANQRVEQLLSQAEQAAANAETKSRQAVDIARKASVISGFILAVSLLIAALAAWWGASIGGRHRDEGIDFSRFTTWS